MGAAFAPAGFGGGSIAAIFASSGGPPADVTTSWGQVAEAVLSSSRTVAIAPTANGTGYWEVEGNGTVASFGSAQNYGSVTGRLNAPIVGMASTPDGKGYWLVGTDGGIFNFRDASFYRSTGSLPLNKPLARLAPAPDGPGASVVSPPTGRSPPLTPATPPSS